MLKTVLALGIGFSIIGFADTLEEISLKAGGSTYVVAHEKTYKVTCEAGAASTIVSRSCYCAGPTFAANKLVLSLLDSTGTLKQPIIDTLIDRATCNARLNELKDTICKTL